MRDVGVAQELPVELGRGPAIDRPHHVAIDISDPPLAPDGTPSCIHTKGKDNTLPEEEERHGILEHFRAVELPGALESPLVAGGAAEDRDRIAQLRPQRIEGSGPAHGQAVGHGDAEARRSACDLPPPARRWTASLALARIDPATSVETDLATPDTA